MCRWIIIASLGLSAATCGQKGPLYLPEENVRCVSAEKHQGSLP